MRGKKLLCEERNCFSILLTFQLFQSWINSVKDFLKIVSCFFKNICDVTTTCFQTTILSFNDCLLRMAFTDLSKVGNRWTIPLCFKLLFKGKEETHSLLLWYLSKTWFPSNILLLETGNTNAWLSKNCVQQVESIDRGKRIYKHLASSHMLRWKFFFQANIWYGCK